MRSVFFVVLLIALNFVPSFAKADIFGDVWSVVTDPLKIRSGSKELSGTVDRAIASLEFLQEEFDSDVRDYIEELKELLRQADSGIEARINQAKRAALEVEKQIFSDANKLIDKIECSAERFTMGTLPEALFTMLQQVEKSGIEIDLPLGASGKLTLEAVKALDRDQAYIFTRDAKLEEMDYFSADTSAYQIVSTYQNIAELAYKTHCHYDRSKGSELFLREFAEYSAKLRPWLSTVTLSVQR